ARRLRVRERRLAGRAGRFRRRGARAAVVRRVLALVAVLGAAAAGFAYVNSTKPPWYERLRYPLAYEQIVRGHARHYRLDPALLAAVIYQESKFRSSARSSSGASGLMQLHPATAEGIAIRTGGTRFR